MGRNAATRCMLSALVLTLAACSSGSKQAAVNPNLYPVDYKREILAAMRQLLADPTQVRDAFISDPVLTPVDKDQRYALCLRANARDAKGQYTGSADSIAYFYGGHLNLFVRAKGDECSKAAYKPFPELEKLTFSR
ncbi:MAG: hypothetical protein WD073_04970 [Xanthobacteraceae bacterium]